MASVTPKLRSRKLGAAIALDDFDKRLLNAMQGSFPIEPRPYASVAAALEVPEERVLARVGELVDERIIRQITPIFDTRALGYGSMLVAAKVDPEHPWRAARIINSHPGVSHNYLRNHDFNMWFTLAVEEDSALGLDGTLDVLQELTGAESIRQLPTLKLFKIRMDLELVGGTDELAKSAVAEDPDRARQAALRRARHGRHPRHPGRPADRRRALRGGGRRAGHERRRAGRAPARDGRPRPAAPRRRDPLSPPRRLQRQRHGRLAGPRRAASPRSARGWPPTAGSRTATSARPTPTGRTRSSPWRTGAPRRSATRSSTRSPSENPEIEARATLYSSTEFKKIRLLYFTEDFKAWEREHASV